MRSLPPLPHPLCVYECVLSLHAFRRAAHVDGSLGWPTMVVAILVSHACAHIRACVRTYARTHARTHAHTHTHTHVRTHSRTDSRTHPRAPWMEQDGYTREQCEVLGRPFYAAKAGVGKKWGMFCVN